MPLTIKPMNSVSAFNLDYIADAKEYAQIRIWIGDFLPFTDGAKPIVYSCPGFIRTEKSLWVKKAHNCDNMQLSGDLTDMSYLHHWRMKTLTNSFGQVYQTPAVLADGTTGYFSPVSQFLTWNDTSLYPYTQIKGNYPMILVTLTGSRGLWTSFSYPVDGVYNSGSSTKSFYLYRTLQENGTTYERLKFVTFDVSNTYRTMAYLTGTLIPLVRSQLENGWDLYLSDHTSNSYLWYTEISSLVPSESWIEKYISSSPEWLSAIERESNVSADFGELHYRALSKIDVLDINGLAYLKDLKELLSTIKSIIMLAEGKVSPKSIADAYLVFKYGPAMTAADTKDIASSLKDVRRSGVSSTEVTGVAYGTLKVMTTIRYNPKDSVWEDVYNLLRRLDVLANPENLWDLVPFSFVVDWFAHVDDVVERLDQFDHLSHLDISAVYDTTILDVSYLASRFLPSVLGTIDVHRFHRNCGWDASFPLIVPQEPQASSHWLEGTALIIQRLFK